MFDAQLNKSEYAKLNSAVSRGNMKFYLAAAAMHTIGFMGLSFYFRYRRITAIPTVIIGTGYYEFFKLSNNMLYKVLVDRPVLASAREMSLDAHVQPVGTHIPRNITFK